VRSTRRGIALILVLTVVLALVLIATPFVLSMTKQERTATVEKAERQAVYGSEGVRNFAAATLIRGRDESERRTPGALWTTPYSDTESEFAIDLRDPKLATLKILDMQGKIWGVVAEDEQAKVNVRTAPERLIRTLRTHVDARVIDFKDYTTAYSARASRWLFPQRVRAVGQITLITGATVSGVRVDNAVHYGRDLTGRDMKLRFTRPGGSPFITTVRANYLLTDGDHVIEPLEMPPPGVQIVEVEGRHPVNLNTARRETIAALLEGVSINLGPQLTDQISRDEAMQLAAQIRTRTFESWREFAAWLAQTSIGSIVDRLAALIALADPTNAALNGTGTMPGCFTSPDTVTLQARAMMNTPAGTPMSAAGFREVVDLGPPVPIIWALESQHDFDSYLSSALFAANELNIAVPNPLPALFNGFPWGNRVVTFPQKFPNPSDKALKPQPATAEAYIQLDHARDLRGGGQYLNTRDHFDAEIEGMKLSGGSTQDYPWDQAFSENPKPQLPAPNLLFNTADNASGGMEVWVRFDALGPTTIFDIRENDKSNRLTLELVGAELVFKATDATLAAPTTSPNIVLEKGFAEVRFPFVPILDTWYHVGIYWKGTKWAHLAMLVDGFCDPQAKFRHVDDVTGLPTITELASILGVPAPPPAPQQSPISLRDDRWITRPPANELLPIEPEPNFPPLMIGDEVIHYDTVLKMAQRGMRGTAPRQHPAGAKAQLFGYTSKLRPLNFRINFGAPGTLDVLFNQLPNTSGAVRHSFGQDPQATLIGETDDGTGNMIVTAAQTTIKFNSPDVSQWPQQGYILVQQEVIYYDSINAATTPPQFESCVRGQLSTTPANHPNGVAATLFSIAATNNLRYLSPTFVQINDEWFGPVQSVFSPGGLSFFVGVGVGGPPPMLLLFNRAGFGSRQTAHAAGENIIPIFATLESDPSLFRLNCQRWDWITVSDAANNRELRRVRRSAVMPPPPPNITFQWVGGPVPNPSNIQLVALWDHVTRPYVPDERFVRVMKWPSGELLSFNWLQNANPVASFGTVGAITIDEVKFFASPKGNFKIAAQADANVKTITMNAAGALGQEGAVKIGDEIIGFPLVTNNDLRRCQRGWLNSPAQVHSEGELAFNLSFLPITKLTADCAPEDRYLQVRRPMQGAYQAGYALIGTEVVGFEALTNNGQTYDCWGDLSSGAFWRGRFGTTAAAHSQDDLMYGIPFRHWDTRKALHWDSRCAYFQASITARGARWRSLQWDEQIPAGDALLRTHCLVRADGMGEWFDPPGQDARTLLWDFVKPNVPNGIDHASGWRDAGQLDVRFEVEYLPTAFWPNHAWKRSPRWRQLQVSYERPTKVVFHEDE